ncbi:MAG TPA: DUF4129 domain-containing protein [Terracidiphilus sp.]|nr:DUF4129 domain-containing protein [Terracidiphilus sp.]
MTARLLCGGMMCLTGVAQIPTPHATTSAGRWRDATLDEYKQHLIVLNAVVDACEKARDLKTCDPMLVGPDDRVPVGSQVNAERRLIRYGWLRVLISKAEEPDQAPPKQQKQAAQDPESALPPPPTTSQLLRNADQRLRSDLAQADNLRASATSHAEERSAMQQVLAGRDFRGLEQTTVRDSVLEKVGDWLNHLIERATRLQARSAWIGRAIVIGFMVAVCVGLVWALIQLERKWRVRLVPQAERPAADAASTRDWQLWLEDARKAAAAGQWREAIHFVYWAAISRLESRRMWPADRARTPREYLALVASEDPRRANLARLTGSFERTWYGGQAAAESDYQAAEQIANTLILGTGEPARRGAT